MSDPIINIAELVQSARRAADGDDNVPIYPPWTEAARIWNEAYVQRVDELQQKAREC